MKAQLVLLALIFTLEGVQLNQSPCAIIVAKAEVKTCISVDAINQAFTIARERVRLTSPARSFVPTEAEVDLIGRALVETTRLLSQTFNLSPKDIHNGLPQVNTLVTDIGNFCPGSFQKMRCEVQRFRTLDGSCNNLENGHQGAALSSMRRVIPSSYADGVSTPRVSVTGQPLPSARIVSAIVHRDLGYHDHAITTFLPAWGQMIDHDMARGGDTIDPKTRAEPECCQVQDPKKRHPACFPVEVPKDDPFYSLFRLSCLNLVRTATGLKDYCRLGARGGLNAVSSYLDASHVYGLTEDVAISLREMRGGLLKANKDLRSKGLKDLLPPKTVDPDQNCNRPSPDTFCFLAGDARVNQQPLLATQHVLLLREHNRMARELGKINPHWDDERIYQETRHIMAALVQKITYHEFLPLVLGKEAMDRFNLLPLKDGYLEDYDSKLDATLTVPFFTSAFRFGHSVIPPVLERSSSSYQHIGVDRLRDLFNQPFGLYKEGLIDQFIAGMANQVAQAMDDSVTTELTNHLFQEAKNQFGSDLASMNMQRGRDNGVSSYNAYREFCNLKRARTWDDLAGVFSNETLVSYSRIYATPDDIDLWSGGISERPKKGSLVGPVFSCLIGEGFRNLRFGDRFWFENSGWPSSFTLDQLREIRRVKLSRIVCDNTDNIDSVQVYIMALPDPEINPRVPCKSSILPRLNLQAWKEQ